jgi:type IV pilus assembly protein PilW
MNTIPYQPPTGYGFSLVELLVAMTIGLFLAAGVIDIFVNAKQMYVVNAAASTMQENGRYALQIMVHSIRMAGFTGCPGSNPITNRLNNNTYWWENFATSLTGSPLPTPATFGASTQSIGTYIMGYDGTQAFPLFHTSAPTDSPAAVRFQTATPAGSRVPGTDALITLGGDGGYTVTANATPNLTLASLAQPSGGSLRDKDLLIACDSTSAALFQVTGVATPGNVITHAASGTAPGNSTASLPMDATPAQEMSLVDYTPTAFYIGASSSGAVTNSLWQLRYDGNGAMTPMELVEGVQDMQLLYGEDTDGDGAIDVYSDATSVTNWGHVVAMRIYLLLTTLDDNVIPQPQTYLFPADTGDATKFGRTRTAGDHRIYQVFSTTVGIRNRLG